MKLSTNKRGQYTVRLSDYPSESELNQLNALNLGTFKVCEKRGYKRLLHATGTGARFLEMECPINEQFRV